MLILQFIVLSLPGILAGQCRVLLWEDDFSGTVIDTTHWNVVNDNSGGGNDELQFYTARDTNVFVRDGHLVIRALEEEYAGHQYTSGKITTRDIVDWRYGRFEAKIRLPEGQGIWPAFWMLPSQNVYGEWPNSGEIDIMELVGNEPNTIYGTLHYGPPWNYTNGMYSLEEGTFSDTSHVFAVEWTADTIKWYVDDELYSLKTRASLVRSDQWKAFQERFYMILNLAVGGNWPGPPDETTTFPQTMEVDYVKVYGDPALQEIIPLDSAYAMAKNVQYTMTDIPGAQFTWSVPEGCTITSGQGTHTIAVDWGCTPGNIELMVTGVDCADQYYTCPVNFAHLEIRGEEQTFPLDQQVFIVPEFNQTAFTWSYPEDATLLNDAGDSLFLEWGCSDGSVGIELQNSCGRVSDSLQVTIKEPKITGPTTVSENSLHIGYAISNIPKSTFDWTVPPGASIVRGQGDDSISVNFGSEDGNVAVNIQNVCYNSTYSIPIRITDTLLLADYETTFLEFFPFSSTSFEQVMNPAPDSVNPSEHVGKSFKSEVTWSGIYTDLGYNLDLSTHKKFQLKVMGPKTGQVLLKLEDHDEDVTPYMQVFDTLTKINEWEELEFIFPGAPSGVFDRITLFFDFGSAAENTYYFDDLTLLPYGSSAAPSMVSDSFSLYPNPFRDIMRFILPGDESPEYITIYNMQGRIMYQQSLLQTGNNTLELNSLSPGIYLLMIHTHDKVFKNTIIKQ